MCAYQLIRCWGHLFFYFGFEYRHRNVFHVMETSCSYSWYRHKVTGCLGGEFLGQASSACDACLSPGAVLVVVVNREPGPCPWARQSGSSGGKAKSVVAGKACRGEVAAALQSWCRRAAAGLGVRSGAGRAACCRHPSGGRAAGPRDWPGVSWVGVLWD